MEVIRQWKLILGFIISFVCMAVLAEEVQWFGPFFYRQVRNSETGVVSLSGNIADSHQRSVYHIFDRDLKLQKTLRLLRPLTHAHHNISLDAEQLVVESASSDQLLFEVLPLKPNAMHRSVSVPQEAIDKVTGKPDSALYVRDVSLIATPSPKIFFCNSTDAFIFDFDGNIVDHLNDYVVIPSSHSPIWIATVERQRVASNIEYSLKSYSIKDKFNLAFVEPQKWTQFSRTPIKLSSQGRIAIQERDTVRIIAADPSGKNIKESTWPCPSDSATLVAISKSGESILFETHNGQIVLVSTESGEELGRFSAPGTFYSGQSRFVGEDRIATVSELNLNQLLTIWEWKSNTAKSVEVSTSSHIPYVIASVLFFIALVVVHLYFYRQCKLNGYSVFGFVAMISFVSLVIRWIHLNPRMEGLTDYSDMSYWLAAFVCWQCLFSLVSIWSFKRLKLMKAASVTMLLAAFIAYMLVDVADQDVLCSSMFLFTGLGVIVANLVIAWKKRSLVRITLLDLLIFTAVAAVASQLLTTHGNYLKLIGHAASGFMMSWLVMLLLVLEVKISSSARRWTYTIVSCCVILALTAAVYCFPQVFLAYKPNFVFGLAYSTLLAFGCVLVFNHRFFHYPAPTFAS